MGPSRPPRLRISELDHRRLHLALVEEALRISDLEAELARAEIIPDGGVPEDVVSMNSRVRYRDDRGEERDITLVFPDDAGPDRLSVTSPIGAALIGLAVGDEISWETATGPRRITVVDVYRRPEAGGRRAP